MRFLINLVTILCLICSTKATQEIHEILNDSSNLDSYKSGILRKCNERICSRIYRSLCVSIHGVLTTLPSSCILEKLRCGVLMLSLLDPKAPYLVIRVVHDGACDEPNAPKAKQRQNSKFLKFPEYAQQRGPY